MLTILFLLTVIPLVFMYGILTYPLGIIPPYVSSYSLTTTAKK